MERSILRSDELRNNFITVGYVTCALGYVCSIADQYRRGRRGRRRRKSISKNVKKHVEESKVDALLREAKESIQRADELREECEFARNVAEDAENASDFLLVMFQQGKNVSQTHLSNALIHAEKMYGKFTLLSVECEKASAEAVRKVRKAKDAEKMAEKYERVRLIRSTDGHIPPTDVGELEKNQPERRRLRGKSRWFSPTGTSPNAF